MPSAKHGQGRKPRPVRPAKPENARKRRQRDATAWLKKTWPGLFGNPPKALAIGVGRAIRERAREAGLPRNAIFAALYFWTRSHGYLKALAADGAQRWNLDGAAGELVASEHQAEARKRIGAGKKSAKP